MPASRVHRNRCVEVLGHRRGEYATHIGERSPPNHRGGPTPEHRVLSILVRCDHIIEKALFMAPGSAVLDRVSVREVVGRLHQRNSRVGKVPKRRVQDPRQRNVVRVEHQDELAIRHPECVVDVAGLGVFVIGPSEIDRAVLLSQLAHLVAPTVVEQEGAMRPTNRIAPTSVGSTTSMGSS